VEKSPPDQSVIAEAIAWSSRITTVALEMVIPGAVGYWVDQRLGTVAVFLILGVVIGMTTGLMHLLRMASPPSPRETDKRREQDDPR
jgi:F0F1-type ATP synthase assembly protein I